MQRVGGGGGLAVRMQVQACMPILPDYFHTLLPAYHLPSRILTRLLCFAVASLALLCGECLPHAEGKYTHTATHIGESARVIHGCTTQDAATQHCSEGGLHTSKP